MIEVLQAGDPAKPVYEVWRTEWSNVGERELIEYIGAAEDSATAVQWAKRLRNGEKLEVPSL